MKFADSWYWPDNEQHLLDWLMNPKARKVINGRPAYQGKKQLAALESVHPDRRRTAIDVGGHIGLWSYNLAHWFKRVEAFEPVAAHRDCFMKNVLDSAPLASMKAAHQPADANETLKVNLHYCALGDREDSISIHTSDTSSGDSWVKGKGTIPMKTLDSFEFTEVDLIKIDCEGYEEFVLRGGEATIVRDKPIIVVEQKRDMARKFGLQPLGAVKFLISLGYIVVEEISGDYIMKVKP